MVCVGVGGVWCWVLVGCVGVCVYGCGWETCCRRVWGDEGGVVGAGVCARGVVGGWGRQVRVGGCVCVGVCVCVCVCVCACVCVSVCVCRWASSRLRAVACAPLSVYTNVPVYILQLSFSRIIHT